MVSKRDLLFLAASFRFPCWTSGGYHFDRQTNDMFWLQQRDVFKCSGSPTYNWNSQCNFGEFLEHHTTWCGKSLASHNKEGHAINVSLPMISVQYHSLLTFCYIGWFTMDPDFFLPVTLLLQGYLKLIPFKKNKPPPPPQKQNKHLPTIDFQSETRLLSGWVVSTIAIFFLASLFQFVSPLLHKNPRNG